MAKDKISKEEVGHIATLAKLKLSDTENNKYQSQLSEIVNYIGQLEKLNTANTVPTSQVTNLENVLREDEIKPSLSQEEVLSNPKKTQNGYFVTDAVFEE